MSTIQLCVLGPIIITLAYGFTHLMWTAVGISPPRRTRRRSRRVMRTREVGITAKRPIAAITHGRMIQVRDLAAMPRENSHGIGAHLDN